MPSDRVSKEEWCNTAKKRAMVMANCQNHNSPHSIDEGELDPPQDLFYSPHFV